MAEVKLLLSLIVLIAFNMIAKLEVPDEYVWIGLCVVLSAYIMYQPAEDKIFIQEKEDEDE